MYNLELGAIAVKIAKHQISASQRGRMDGVSTGLLASAFHCH